MNNNINILNNKKGKKVPLYVFISEEVEKPFRRFIALKHQTTEKGLLSLEVEQAMRHYMASQSTQQQNTQSGRSASQNQIIKVKRVMEDIQKYLIESGIYVDIPQFVPEKHLDQAIANVRGLDKRTIKTWKQHLVQHGYIKKKGNVECVVLVVLILLDQRKNMKEICCLL